MDKDKESNKKTTIADDNISNNAHYSESGEITREDDRDRHNSTEDWDAEKNRSGRHK